MNKQNFNTYYIPLLIFFITIISLCSCGIEDSMYFQEPQELEIVNNDTESVEIRFKGYNQEKQGIYYLFVGYDVYYYFDKIENRKKAVVRYPYNSSNLKLIDLSTDYFTITDPLSENKFRFPNPPFTIMDDFYKNTTIPVTLDMIDKTLSDKTDNVRFCFHNNAINDKATQKNPHNNSGNYIYMDMIYPNPTEYEGKYDSLQFYWGDDTNFKGFYDIDYYNYYNIKPYRTEGSTNTYRLYIYIVAKGYNSADDIDRNPNFTESANSPVISILIRVPTL